MGKSTIAYATIAGIGGGLSVSNYFDYAAQKTAALQAHLSRAPELTDKVIEAANQAVEGIGEANIAKGFLFAGLAGLFSGLALYDAAKTRR